MRGISDSGGGSRSAPPMYFIYSIFNTVNGKIYIGKTNNLRKRWNAHKRISLGGKEKFPRTFSIIHSAITKYGIDKFEFLPIHSFESEDDAYKAETYWISYFNTREPTLGYNISPGGEGSGSGINSPNYGLIRSDETKLKLKESHLGSKNSNYNKEFSLETRLKMSKSQKGNQSGEKNPRSILNWNAVNQIRDLYKNGVGATQLSKQFNVSRANIYSIINNKSWIK